MSTLAERLIEARTEKGWKKSDLMRAAGLKSSSTLSDLERGAITDSPQLAKIAHALGVEVMWLQFGTGPKRDKEAKSVEVSKAAMNIALIVNEMPQEYQVALLHLISLDAEKHNALAIKSIQQQGEEKRLRLPEQKTA